MWIKKYYLLFLHPLWLHAPFFWRGVWDTYTTLTESCMAGNALSLERKKVCSFVSNVSGSLSGWGRFEKNQVFWEEREGGHSRRHSQNWELGTRRAGLYSAPWTELPPPSGPWTVNPVAPSGNVWLESRPTENRALNSLIPSFLQPDLSHLLLNLRERDTESRCILRALVRGGDNA